MKNLLITGGTGFFGRALLRHIDSVKRTNDYLPFDQITVMSRTPEIFKLRFPSLAKLSGLHFHKGDVLLPNTFPQDGNFHYVIHAASDSTNALAMSPHETYQQIVEGTENMLKFASIKGVRRFLFTSSGAVYGIQADDVKAITESYNRVSDKSKTIDTYGLAKRHAEYLCKQYGKQFNLDTIIARCFAFVGEDLSRNNHFAIGNFIRDAIERPEIIINGNGKQVRSYMYQDDLALWLLKLLLYGIKDNAYNVGSDKEITLFELAHLVRDILSPEKKIKILDSNMVNNSFRSRYLPDITKVKNELGLKINVDLSEAILMSAKKFNMH